MGPLLSRHTERFGPMVQSGLAEFSSRNFVTARTNFGNRPPCNGELDPPCPPDESYGIETIPHTQERYVRRDFLPLRRPQRHRQSPENALRCPRNTESRSIQRRRAAGLNVLKAVFIDDRRRVVRAYSRPDPPSPPLRAGMISFFRTACSAGDGPADRSRAGRRSSGVRRRPTASFGSGLGRRVRRPS